MCVGQDITDQDTGSPTKLFHQPFAQPMAHPRKQLLREWLQEQLEMGRFPGVYYVNVAGTPPKSHFRIPWLHKAKPNWNEEYLALFRAWSEHTGYLKKTDTATDIKSRLRCALAKAPDIRHVPELQSREDDDCYRVYRFVSEDERKSHTATPHPLFLAPGISQQLYQLKKDEITYPFPNFNGGTVGVWEWSSFVFAVQSQPSTPVVNSAQERKPHIPQTFLPPGISQSSCSVDVQRQPGTPTVDSKGMPGAKVTDGGTQQDGNYMTVKVFYGSVKKVERPFRAMCSIDRRDDQPTAQHITLPPLPNAAAAGSSSQLHNREEVQRLFEHMQKDGLLLEYDRGDIYATRHTLVHIFHTNFFNHQKSSKLDRGVRTPIFSIAQMQQFLDDHPHDKKPTSSVLLSYGRRSYYEAELQPECFRAPITTIVTSMQAEVSLQHHRMDTEGTDDELQISDDGD